MTISPDQKTKMATVGFKTLPACFTSNRSEWSFKIPDDESSDAKKDDSDDDIIPMLGTYNHNRHPLQRYHNTSNLQECVEAQGRVGLPILGEPVHS